MAPTAITNPNHREITLYNGHQNEVAVSTNNLVELIAFTPPINSQFLLESIITPVIKLFDGSGNEIPADSVLFIGRQTPGEEVPVFAPGQIPYRAFRDLTTAEQRNRDNRATLRQMLNKGSTKGYMFSEEQKLVVYIRASVTVDLDQAGTAFEIPVKYQTR